MAPSIQPYDPPRKPERASTRLLMAGCPPPFHPVVLLGENYFAERSAKQAADIATRRAEDVARKIDGLHHELKRLEDRRAFTSAMGEDDSARGIAEDENGFFEIREDYESDAEPDVEAPGAARAAAAAAAVAPAAPRPAVVRGITERKTGASPTAAGAAPRPTVVGGITERKINGSTAARASPGMTAVAAPVATAPPSVTGAVVERNVGPSSSTGGGATTAATTAAAAAQDTRKIEHNRVYTQWDDDMLFGAAGSDCDDGGAGIEGGDGDGEDGGDEGGDEGEPAAVTAARLAYEDALTALTDEGSAEELPELGRLRATLDAAMGLRETSDSEDDGSDGEEQPVEMAAPTVHTEGS